MHILKSEHYTDATTQMGFNRCRKEILERGKSKWGIVKTLIHNCGDKPLWAYYLDQKGNCVYYTLIINDDFAIIGEASYTNEEVIVI